MYMLFTRESIFIDIIIHIQLLFAPLFLAAAFSAAALARLSAVTGSPRSGGGSQVTMPSLAASRRFLWPSSPARPRTPAMSWIHRRLSNHQHTYRNEGGKKQTNLSSLAGIGYVTQVGSASVSITPIVGILCSPHSCNKI